MCLVLLPGLCGHEAGREVEHGSKIGRGISSLSLVVEIALVAGIVWFVWSHINRGERRRQLEVAGDSLIFKRTLFRLTGINSGGGLV